MKAKEKINLKIILFIAVPITAFLLSFCCGRFEVSPIKVILILKDEIVSLFGGEGSGNYSSFEYSAVISMRLPRILLGMLVGAGLSISGAALQGMFSNPLVSPQVLGVSSGAGFGAALAILLLDSMFITQISAVLMGLAAVAITYFIGKLGKNSPTVFTLVLAGTITSAFFEALISGIKFVADPLSKLPQITYWLMGSLANTSMNDIKTSAPLIIIGSAILFFCRWRINILSLDEDEARATGINLQFSRILVILCCSVITAASVSVCGIIGWIGLVIPHICRSLVGPDNKKLIPACISIGSTYLILIDDLARSLTSAEIPLSILTALIGAPFFAYLLRRSGGEWK